MEVFLLFLLIALYALLDDEEEQADPVSLALPALQELEREAQQALTEIRALDDEDGSRP